MYLLPFNPYGFVTFILLALPPALSEPMTTELIEALCRLQGRRDAGWTLPYVVLGGCP